MVYVPNNVYSALLEEGKREDKSPSKIASVIITTWFNQTPEVNE